MSRYRPADVAKRLGVSTSTLRLWSKEFAAHLSPGAQSTASEQGRYLQRRYAEEDVAVLLRAKALVQGERLTAAQANARLSAQEAPNDSPIDANSSALAPAVAPDWGPVVAAMQRSHAMNEDAHAATRSILYDVQDDVRSGASEANLRLSEEVGRLRERLEATEQRLRETQDALERERAKRAAAWWRKLTGRD